MKAVRIREAKADDVPLILSFLQKKAEYDRQISVFSGDLPVTQDKLRRFLFGKTPHAYVVFASLEDHELAFALYGFRYASYVGQPVLWLEDLYVNEDARKQGLAVTLMNHLFQIGVTQDCSHMAWHADTRNKAGLAFYHHLGAELTEQSGNNCYFKWLGPAS